MKKAVPLLRFLTLLAITLCGVSSTHGQITVDTTVSAQDLVNAISGQGVIITNVNLNCPSGAYGTFTSGGGNLGMTDGILLTTGDASQAIGPNALGSTSGGPCNSLTDNDLIVIEPQATQDVCLLEFDITPQCDTLTLEYVFGSEEYPEFVNSSFNDAFGFFIDGPNPAGGNYAGQNIALIPGTTTAVTIDNINPNTNTQYYVDNAGGATIEYDGFTTVLTATLPVDQCAVYHMKLIIADAGDCSYDSGVFLDFEGLNCPNQDLDIVATIDTAYEGCSDAQFEITRTNTSGNMTVNIITNGSASNPADYTVNNSYTFNNNQGTITVDVPATADGTVEGVETAEIVLEYFICGVAVYDTCYLYIVDEPIINFTATPATCSACDGTATATVTGGTPPYTYAWDAAANNQTTQTATNLCPGNYDVTITDANGCTATNTVTITQTGAITLNVTTIDETCLGDNDGVISATAANGTPTYQYDIGGPQQTSGTFTGLTPGTYTITVTDASGCVETAQVTINAGPLCCTLVPTATFTDVNCNGACDGTATANPVGAIGNVTYNWLDGTNNPINQTTQTATNLCPGTYTVEVTDDNCTENAQVTITEPIVITATVAIDQQITCNGACDGEVTVTASGGTGTLEYSLDGNTYQPGNSFTGICAGLHTAYIRDDNNCVVQVQLTLTEPLALNLTLNSTVDATCGQSNGQLDVTGSGGTPALEYSLDGTNFQPTGIFTGLAPGVYTVTLQDGNNCTTTMNVTINDLSGLTAVVDNQVDVTCFGGADGEVTLLATGSAATPYEYSIDGINFQASPTFTGLTAGNYNITVQDQNGCPFVVSVTINEPPQLIATATITDLLCNGVCDGIIDVTASGGTPNLEYSIDGGINWQTGNVFTSLCAGPYNITVRDANGCDTTFAATVTEPPILTLNVTTTDVTCNAGCDGTVALTEGGGTPAVEYSIDGTTYVASNTFNTLCAGNYTAYVRDANGCVTSTAFTINEPPTLTISLINTVDATCGLPNGEIEVTAAGGTPVLTYSIDGTNYGNTGLFTGLTPGTYDLIVQDANNCSDTIQVNVIDLSGLTAVIGNQVDVSCNGGNDGEVTINASGSAATPYTYSIDGITYVTDSTFTGLTAGNHTITVQDGNGCVFPVGVTITEPAAITGTTTAADPTCNNGCDGTISVNATGGTGNLQFSIDTGATFQASNTFAGLCAGAYELQVIDDNNCLFTIVANLNNPVAVTYTWTSNPASCGNADGDITVTANGGAGNYTYSIDGGPYQASNMFTGLAAGTYTIDVQDQLGCIGTGTANVSNNAAPTLTTTSTNPSCFGMCNGSLNVNVNGGTGPFNYSINGGAMQGNGTFNNLCADTFNIQVVDGNGCIVFDQVILTEPAQITYTTNLTHLSCNQDGTGELTVNATGGDGNFMYSLNAGPAQVSNVFSNLQAGTYTVLVTDGAGCTATGQETITEPAALSMSFAAFDNTCNNACDGYAIVIPSGGTVIGAYTFTWSDPTIGNTANANNLCAGNYSLTVADDNGCFIDTNFIITEPAALGITTSALTSNCNQADGTATVDLTTGGTPGYTYQWDATAGAGVDSFATNLTPGNYNVTIADANGCDTTVTITVPNTPGVIGSLVNSTDASCFGMCDGTAEASATGGVAPYSFAWSNGDNTALTTTLCAGNHYCVVTDASGCIDSVFVTINEPIAVTVNVSNDTTICIGGTATLVAFAAGGTPTYNFNWDNGQTGSSIADMPNTTTTYIVTATDANGCTSAPDTVMVNLYPPMTLTISAPDSICPGDATSVSASVTGGDGGPYQYTWTNDDGTGWVVYGDQQTVNPPQTTTYYVLVTDGCSTPAVIDSVEIVVNPIPVVSMIADTLSGCAPVTVNFTNTTNLAQIGGGCLWEFGDGSTATDCYFTDHTYSTPGSYDVTLTVTSPFGCVGTTTVANMINVYPNPIADFTFSPIPATITDPTIDFTNMSTDADFYNWDFNGLEGSTDEHPTFEFPDAGAYWVELAVSSIYGCTDTIVDSVYIDDVLSIHVPNAFTPDGDGLNDDFLPIVAGANGEDYQFFVFNRWGELIFESYHPGQAWDGTYKGTNAQTDVYVWKLQVGGGTDREVKEYVGHVTLLR